MDFLKGHLLIAAPQLSDPNFARTVVLMIDHDEQGAVGVVLNRPSGRTVKEVWDEVGDEPCESAAAINVGGPVLGPLMAIHTCESLAEAEVLPGVYLAAGRDYLDRVVREDNSDFLVFSGYSGWGKGQLESELKQGGWITKPANKEYIFSNVNDLWQRVGQDITRDVLNPSGKIKHFPDDPSLN